MKKRGRFFGILGSENESQSTLNGSRRLLSLNMERVRHIKNTILSRKSKNNAIIDKSADAKGFFGKKIMDHSGKENIVASIKNKFGLDGLRPKRALNEKLKDNDKAFHKELPKESASTRGREIISRHISKTVANRENIIRLLKEVHRHA